MSFQFEYLSHRYYDRVNDSWIHVVCDFVVYDIVIPQPGYFGLRKMFWDT